MAQEEIKINITCKRFWRFFFVQLDQRKGFDVEINILINPFAFIVIC